jgi:hypothetical protein
MAICPVYTMLGRYTCRLGIFDLNRWRSRPSAIRLRRGRVRQQRLDPKDRRFSGSIGHQKCFQHYHTSVKACLVFLSARRREGVAINFSLDDSMNSRTFLSELLEALYPTAPLVTPLSICLEVPSYRFIQLSILRQAPSPNLVIPSMHLWPNNCFRPGLHSRSTLRSRGRIGRVRKEVSFSSASHFKSGHQLS